MTHTIQALIVSFFHTYLRDQAGCTPHTIQSYCECIRLLIRFCCQEEHITPDELDIEAINDTVVLAFLNSLEQQRGNSARTRNHRLAAIKSFYRYLALQEPSLMDACQRICSIRAKKSEHKIIESLSEKEMQALFDAIGSNTLWDQRDYALILLMYNTGARAQEIVDLCLGDLKLDDCPQIKLTGKGRKERSVPLWEKTADALRQWVKAREQANINTDHLFINKHRKMLTRFGIAYIVKKYAILAANTTPSLHSKNVTPHTLRHTTAMHLIQSDVGIDVVKDWLGHADIRTACLYVDISVEMKRKALEKCPPPAVEKAVPALWHQPTVMALLHSIASRSYVE